MSRLGLLVDCLCVGINFAIAAASIRDTIHGSFISEVILALSSAFALYYTVKVVKGDYEIKA